MLRLIVKVTSSYARCPFQFTTIGPKLLGTQLKNFQQSFQNYSHISSILQNDRIQSNFFSLPQKPSLLQNTAITQISKNIRPVTKFSLRKGKRKSVKAVISRFYRLNWGGWIRTKVGRHKKMWKKTENNKRRLRQHVLVSGTQSWLLDKMVTKYWRKPKYYVDDPYEPYHEREEYFITRKKPIS